MKNVRKKTSIFLLMCIATFTILIFRTAPARGDDVDLFTATAPANVLFILDNSNSMDEDFVGNAICSWRTGSRSVEGRKALISLIDTYINSMRIGLMSYKLSSASKYYLHNAAYFASYQPKSYCPDPPPECEEYCKTGDLAKLAICQASCILQNASFDGTYRDEILTYYAIGSEQRNRYCGLCYPKENRYINPTDTSHYVYYKIPGTMYASSNYGTRFAYSTNYNPTEGNTDNYYGYSQKTGTSDSFNYSNPSADGYSSYQFYWGFSPTDEDWALGFGDFGRRLTWYYTGRTWFSSSSPGDGYLHVACDDNNTANDNHKDALLAKLATHENDETGYMSCTSTSNPNSCSYIVNAGLTPTAGTLQEAIDYFTGAGSYSTPIQYWCQKNFIIYVTDGLPSVNESGGTDSADNLMPAVLAKIDALRDFSVTISGKSYDFDVKTYVIGLGLTDAAKTKLDTMAVHGGTAVNGNAYYADDISELVSGLSLILQDVIENSYSFAATSVSSSRVADENYMYEASFQPIQDDPFWTGHIKKYNINADGSVGSEVWDSGDVLQSTDPAARTIKTYKSGALTAFTTTNITATDLGVSTDDERDTVIGYIRGESAYNPDNWKLGDIFHSSPITIGTPSATFYDTRDTNQTYETFRTNHVRSTANGIRTVVAGANEGQFHAFLASTGAESWSFIPPNLLPKLQDIVHTTHPTALSHQYFVDGYVTVADVWLGSGTGTAKSVADWHTLVMFGLKSGGASNLWSSSTSCDSGFNATYSTTYPYYGGFYCLDVTDPTSPLYRWRINPSATEAPYLGAPWSKIFPGRVLISGSEKWVGFLGAGYNDSDCVSGSCDTRGKGLFVIDMSNGNVLWAATRVDFSGMDYSMPAPAAIVDTDNDGFIDTAYCGDLGGNMWRFKLCTAADGSSCNITDWTASMLYDSPGGTIRPIYTAPAVARDSNDNIWVYFGTGDKSDPTGPNAQEMMCGIKDNDRSTTWTVNDLDNITSSTYTDSSSKQGWYINLTGGGQKVLAEPTVFGGVLYFTTFTPDQSGDPCAYGGDANLFAVDYVTGAGKLDGGARDMVIGTGVSTAPVISLKPGSGVSPDLYVTISGGSEGGIASTIRVNFDPPGLVNRTNMLFWLDRRLQ